MAMSYDPTKVTVTVDGSIITGWADDGMIKIAANGDGVTQVVSVQGEMAYTDNPDKSGKLTLSLAQTSASMSRLRALYNKKSEFAVVVNDANADGGFVLSASGCRILKMPDIERGKDLGKQDIEIAIPNITAN